MKVVLSIGWCRVCVCVCLSSGGGVCWLVSYVCVSKCRWCCVLVGVVCVCVCRSEGGVVYWLVSCVCVSK